MTRCAARLSGFLFVLGVFLVGAAPPLQAGETIAVIEVVGTINPASSEFIRESLAAAEQAGDAAFIIELDTPGGLVTSTKDIIQAILAAEIPVIVFVSPQGAWAGSAGTFITLAGHIAAMAPGTSIGAAHPVGIGGGGTRPTPPGAPADGEEGEAQRPPGVTDVSSEKAENLLAAFIESIAKERNRNVEWARKAVRESVAATADEALELGVIDFVASSRADLLAKLDGREVVIGGVPRILATQGASVRVVEMTAIQRFLHVLASPDLAVLLMLAGLAGLYMEFSNPGTLVPGILGVIFLVLGLVSLQILPFSWLGLFLFFGGLALMTTELFVPSFGAFFVAGIVCMLLGGTMLFDVPDVSGLQVSFWSVLVPAVGSFALFGGLILIAVTRSMGRAQSAGVDEMLGMRGRAESAMAGAGSEGRVFLRGEHWNATAEEALEAGDSVEVVAVEGLRVRVKRPTKE